MWYRKYPGDILTGFQNSCNRPCISSIYRYQCNGWKIRLDGRGRNVWKHNISSMHRGEQLCSRTSSRRCWYHLPLLPEQSDRYNPYKGRACKIRWICKGKWCCDSLWCSIWSLHHRRWCASHHLWNRRCKGSCYRIQKLFKNRRFYRNTLCIHCGS